MNVSPRYLLFSESGEGPEPGRWRFVLRTADGLGRLVVDDVEPDIRGERLELLAVVRGLESLEQPSTVTLLTRSTYVREGIRYGVSEWRENGWRWENFGRMVPVKNVDLWRRIDRALEFHQIECRLRRFDPPHGKGPPPGPIGRDPDVEHGVSAATGWLGTGASGGLRPLVRCFVGRAVRYWRLKTLAWLALVRSV